MFDGKELCVMNGSAKHSKTYLDRKIVELGGTIVQNPGKVTAILFLA